MNKYTSFAIPFGAGGAAMGALFAITIGKFPWGGLITMSIGVVIAIVGRIRIGSW